MSTVFAKKTEKTEAERGAVSGGILTAHSPFCYNGREKFFRRGMRLCVRRGQAEDFAMGSADLSFYRGKRVFVTGHTGFKGSWLCRILLGAGAEVYGCALPPAQPSLYPLAGIEGNVRSVFGDMRDAAAPERAFREAEPQIVFHLAAQPIVRAGYADPAYTYQTNVMGTVNLLECARKFGGVRSFVNVTTDKVYRECRSMDGMCRGDGGADAPISSMSGAHEESARGYAEEDALGGADPYSNSKSCSDLIARCYAQSFFAGGETRISSVRSGNAVGGGDFAPDRILPDCVRAALAGEPVCVRNPRSVRPYQHVLESLSAYLLVAQKQWENAEFAGEYNVGPDECTSTGELVSLFCEKWGGLRWISEGEENAPREAEELRLDNAKIKRVLGWKPRWNIAEAVEMTVEWVKAWQGGGDIPALMDKQIAACFQAG